MIRCGNRYPVEGEQDHRHEDVQGVKDCYQLTRYVEEQAHQDALAEAEAERAYDRWLEGRNDHLHEYSIPSWAM